MAAGVAGLSRLRVLLLSWDRAKLSDPQVERGTLEAIKSQSCPDLHEARISSHRAWAFLDGWVPVLRDFRTNLRDGMYSQCA